MSSPKTNIPPPLFPLIIILLFPLHASPKSPPTTSSNIPSANLRTILSDPSATIETKVATIIAVRTSRDNSAVKDLLSLISQTPDEKNWHCIRSACLTLGALHEMESLSRLIEILNTTAIRQLHAGVALAIAEFPTSGAVCALEGSSSAFDPEYRFIALRKLFPVVVDMLARPENEMTAYAIKAVDAFFETAHVNALRSLLHKRLMTTRNDAVIKASLECYIRRFWYSDAAAICAAIPCRPGYDCQWKQMHSMAGMKYAVPIGKQNGNSARWLTKELLRTNSNSGSSGNPEYGDASYCRNDIFGFEDCGHAGIFAGMDGNDALRVVEVCKGNGGAGLDSCIADNDWNTTMKNKTGYWGTFTVSNKDLGFQERKKIVGLAMSFIGRDVGYTLNPFQGNIDPVLLRHLPLTGDTIHPEDITDFRCDGLVEYCYEYNGIPVWGPKGSNCNVAYKPNLALHNIFFTDNLIAAPLIQTSTNPDSGLAPVVQCGKAGGSSTYMTKNATSDISACSARFNDLDTSIIVYITACDRSGIHRIFCKVGGKGTWTSSSRQPQHPVDSCYTYSYSFVPSGHDTVYYYAEDNAGSGYEQLADAIIVRKGDSTAAITSGAEQPAMAFAISSWNGTQCIIFQNAGELPVKADIRIFTTSGRVVLNLKECNIIPKNRQSGTISLYKGNQARVLPPGNYLMQATYKYSAGNSTTMYSKLLSILGRS